MLENAGTECSDFPGTSQRQTGCAGEEAQGDVGIPDTAVVSCVPEAEATAPCAAKSPQLVKQVGETEQRCQAARAEQGADKVGCGGNCRNTGQPQTEDDSKQRPVRQGEQHQGYPQTARTVQTAKYAFHGEVATGHAAADGACYDTQPVYGKPPGSQPVRNSEGSQLREKMRLDEGHMKSAGEKAEGYTSVRRGSCCKAQHVRKAFSRALHNLHGSLADMGQEDGDRYQKNDGRGK